MEASKVMAEVGNQSSHKNSNSHIDASHSRQPLVKGERLVRYEVNAVMILAGLAHRSHTHLGARLRCALGLWRAFTQGHTRHAAQAQPCLRAFRLERLSLGVSNLLWPLEGLGDGV